MSPTERRRGPQYCDEHQRGDDELLRQVLAWILPAAGCRVTGQDGLHSGERVDKFVEIQCNLIECILFNPFVEGSQTERRESGLCRGDGPSTRLLRRRTPYTGSALRIIILTESFSPTYRVTHFVGKNLPLTQFRLSDATQGNLYCVKKWRFSPTTWVSLYRELC